MNAIVYINLSFKKEDLSIDIIKLIRILLMFFKKHLKIIKREMNKNIEKNNMQNL
ncbi:MAG: hypothetical protein E7F58_11640 [Clostridium saudiense]|uniref:hypothetical protein n=1 Tax=Clostridium saudiense TaxID=1414720 RepID=UPI0029152EA4|nr:hypothetical protein [Clostridium saudiense]MDU3522292.1 hypothetical protein [Clostridium saudiense]